MNDNSTASFISPCVYIISSTCLLASLWTAFITVLMIVPRLVVPSMLFQVWLKFSTLLDVFFLPTSLPGPFFCETSAGLQVCITTPSYCLVLSYLIQDIMTFTFSRHVFLYPHKCSLASRLLNSYLYFTDFSFYYHHPSLRLFCLFSDT